ncbi:MAG TPA: hypothetical protein VOA41_15345 [Candidatus Dormibacteraeota bacterium]|nr:hypothetical protein [Candidatus Dormibacteraeota bacterium]
MRHFSFTDWADFANGLVAPEGNAIMQLHLDEGCKKCQKLLGTCRSIRSLAMRAAEYEPPAAAVQAVKSAFVLHGPQKRRSRVTEMADLVFDSLRQALPAGVRSIDMESVGRKLLYRRGTIQVDLSVNPGPGTPNLQIDGQVLDSATAGHVVPGVVVFLMSAKKKLVQGQTNSMGEFHLECPPRDNLRLCVWISANREVILPLDHHVREVSRGDSRGSS